MYYNSPNFLCKEETRLCELGWLFYILSTLFPLTLIFITVIVLNVNLTIGSLRGFLLFGQVIVLIDSTTSDNAYQIPRLIGKMIYDTFRLRFFYMDHLSFCLKRNATALDVLSFQYIATAYALFLVFVSLFWINYCMVHYNRYCSCVRFTTLKNSFVTGLSALLILCYGSIASISMNILNTATLYHNNHKVGRSRVNLQGNIVYFSLNHLPYALPAIMMLSTIVLAPIILFLLCPLMNKCFDYFQFANSNPASRIASQCYLGGKLKPFFDALQGCFKEKARFFAGMYFLYQIMVIVSKIYPTTRGQEFFHISITLMIFLAIHSLVQPYKERLHNIIDTLLFTNLLIINSLSYYVYLAKHDPDARLNGKVASVLQTILMFVPLIVFGAAILKLVCRKFSWYRKIRRDSRVRRFYSDSIVSSNELKIDSAVPYGATETEGGDLNKNEDEDHVFSASVRNRQFSLSSFVAHEQLLTPSMSS